MSNAGGARIKCIIKFLTGVEILILKKKFLFSALAAVFTLIIPFSVVGCKTGGNVVRINEVTHSVFYAPLYLADALGYFGDEGFKIELTNGGGADKTMAAVLANEADIGFCGPEAVVYAHIGGTTDAPMVFGQMTKRDGSFLVGRTAEPDFDWKDLEGKTIIAGRPGGVPYMTFEYVLKQAGVNATLVNNIDFNMTTAAFEGDIGDYCTMFEPTASAYQAAGKGYIVASVGQESGEIPYTCFMAKQSYIDKNGDKVRGLLKAITKAVKYLDEHDATDVAKLLTKYFDGTDEASIKTSLESYKNIDAWVKNMAMEETAYDRLLDVIEEAGELSRRIPFHQAILTESADRAYREIYG